MNLCKRCFVGTDSVGDGCSICDGIPIDKVVIIRRRIQELLPKPVIKVRRPKNAPKGVEHTQWHYLDEGPGYQRWQFQDCMAVLGKVYASSSPEHAGEFYWVCCAWGGSWGGEKKGYTTTVELAKICVENEVLEPL